MREKLNYQKELKQMHELCKVMSMTPQQLTNHFLEDIWGYQ